MTKSLAVRIREDLEDRADVVAEPARAAVSEWLAADDAFNHWFLETTKGAVDDDTLMALLGGYGETQDPVEEAWRAIVEDGGRDEAALLAAIEASKAKLAQLQKR